MTGNTETENSSLGDRPLLVGAVVILLLGATQYGFELFPKAYLSLVDPVVWLVFAGWCIRALVRRGRPLRNIPLIAVLFLLICSLSAVRATSRINALKDIFQFAEYFLAGYLVLMTVASRRPWRRVLCYTFLAVTSAVVVVAAMQYFRQSVPALEVGGTFGNRNVLGGFLSLALPFAFALLLEHTSVWARALLAVLIVAGVGVLLSGGAALAVAIGFLFVAAWKSRVALVGTGIAILLWTCLAAPHLPRNNQEVCYQSVVGFDEMGELTPRYPEWQAAAVMVLENPWLGVGIGNYQANIGMYYGMLPNQNEAVEPDIQNLYLVLASSAGIGGLICFVAMLARFIAVAALRTRGLQSGLDRGIARGAAGALLAFSIAAVWSPLLVRGIGIPLAFMLALAATAELGEGD